MNYQLSASQTRLLSVFIDSPAIRNVCNNPAKLAEVMTKIENTIKNSPYISGEVKEALLKGRARLNTDGSFVNCEADKNMLNDIVKVATGEDYITKFPSGTHPSEVMYQTPVGEVANVGGQLYVNNGKMLEPINLSETTFRKLFPPISRFSTHQGKVGTCYLVSVIERAYSSPQTRAQVYRLIGEDKYGIYTITANGNGRKTYFRRFDSKYKHIREENGIAIIEQGYCKNSLQKAHGVNLSETQIMGANSGGFAWYALEGLFGILPNVTSDMETMRRYIMLHANNPNHIMNAATKHGGYSDDTHLISREYNLYSGHEYSIKGYDRYTDCVILSNPHHAGCVIRVPMNEFLRCFREVSLASFR